MNNDQCVQNNVAQSEPVIKYITPSAFTAKPNTASKYWSMSITIIVVGLPALLFFLA